MYVRSCHVKHKNLTLFLFLTRNIKKLVLMNSAPIFFGEGKSLSQLNGNVAA